MRKKYTSRKVKFYIGDVRDIDSIEDAIRGVDYIFHAAALKQVPSCEFFPFEAVKTNIIGTNNILELAVKHEVKKVICLSTDKAAYPINSMGISKAMMEKIAIAKSRTLPEDKTVICLTRYGNVMGSRGSVIPLFSKLIDDNKDITITVPTMTRFVMSLEQAVDLVLFAFENGKQGDLFIQKAPSSSVDTLADAIMQIKGKIVRKVVIGARHGEKQYEVLVTKEEMSRSIDMGGYFRIPADYRDLNYDEFINKGLISLNSDEYNSDNTKILDVKQLVELIQESGIMENLHE